MSNYMVLLLAIASIYMWAGAVHIREHNLDEGLRYMLLSGLYACIAFFH